MKSGKDTIGAALGLSADTSEPADVADPESDDSGEAELIDAAADDMAAAIESGDRTHIRKALGRIVRLLK